MAGSHGLGVIAVGVPLPNLLKIAFSEAFLAQGLGELPLIIGRLILRDPDHVNMPGSAFGKSRGILQVGSHLFPGRRFDSSLIISAQTREHVDHFQNTKSTLT